MAQSNNTYLSPFSLYCTTKACLNGPFCTSCTKSDDQCKFLQKKTDFGNEKTNEVNLNARYRCYVHPMLKPIENSEQWKLAKKDKTNVAMLAGKNVKKSNARDRRYNNPVLKPVESLAQWNLIKTKKVTFDV
ncbi:hypothetical protein L195_g007282 [Trifolium pratense]|uniref:Uncharacterized protein n=2 Tax=Trifolium pratense TaxID=57577 RepID=A0A2K3P5X6_TRIPR|nr:hypothetical protein L195_g007282 [Trifolium pratense]CAJ2672592.1 unnamed protein product [Trifolium pratense]